MVSLDGIVAGKNEKQTELKHFFGAMSHAHAPHTTHTKYVKNDRNDTHAPQLGKRHDAPSVLQAHVHSLYMIVYTKRIRARLTPTKKRVEFERNMLRKNSRNVLL